MRMLLRTTMRLGVGIARGRQDKWLFGACSKWRRSNAIC
jgi:hypothetical protein